MQIEPTQSEMQDYILSGPRFHDRLNGNEETALSENITITDDDVFLYDSSMDIMENLDDIASLIAYHEEYIAPKYQIKRDYYKGRHHSILNAPEKDLNKPDNRLIVNLPKKLVNTFNGFFSGESVDIKYTDKDTNNSQIDSINDQIQEWLKLNNYTDLFSEWSKQADIYGRSYLRLYLTDNEIHMAICSPRDTFVVYDDSVRHTPLFAVTYSTSSIKTHGTLILPDADYQFSNTRGSIETTNTTLMQNEQGETVEMVDTKDVHNFDTLPVIEFAENAERMGVFDDVISLVDSVDRVLSDKNNDVDSFADAYMVVTGIRLTPKQIEQIRNNRLINLYMEDKASFTGETKQDPQVSFLTPDSNDTTQENTLNRAIDLIYQITQIVNLNDSNFGMSAQSISGVALINRYQPMQAKARTKAQKMDNALRDMFRVLFQHWNVSVPVSDLTFDHKQAIPHNISEEADTVKKLDGQVSQETKLKALSMISDPAKEIEKLHDEQEEAQKEADKRMAQYLPDQQKGELNGGNNTTGTPADNSTNTAGQSDKPTS